MKSNILVVDDEPVARQSMSDILRLEGFAVNSVPNGQAAIEYVRTHPIELMIVDLRMPGMSGGALQEEMLRRAVPLPVVIITALVMVDGAAGSKPGFCRQWLTECATVSRSTRKAAPSSCATLVTPTIVLATRQLPKQKRNAICVGVNPCFRASAL